MAQVKLILSEDMPNLGYAGDLISVKPGYARNYLLPQGKAILATATKVRELEHHKRIVAEKVARQLKDLEAAKKKIEKLRLKVEASAGTEGRLFGSVTVAQISGLLAAEGYEIDRRRIQLKDPIKQTGEHKVQVRLHRDLVAEIHIEVTASGTPPEEAPKPEEPTSEPAETAEEAEAPSEDSPEAVEE